jgi:hypothetical protein
VVNVYFEGVSHQPLALSAAERVSIYEPVHPFRHVGPCLNRLTDMLLGSFAPLRGEGAWLVPSPT